MTHDPSSLSARAGRHPTALVDPGASIHPEARIGPFAIIHAGVEIAADVEIGAYCEIGIPTPLARQQRLVIGPGSIVRSHSRIYVGSDFSKGLSTGHGVTMRENIVAGWRFQLGSYGDIEGDCAIGDDVRTHNNVLVSKNSVIGNFVWLAPFVHLTDDPHPPSEVRRGVTVRDFAMIAARTTVLPGVTIGADALVGAGSVVSRDVPDGMIAVGAPAELRGPAARILRKDGSNLPAYPWRRHFHRGYPAEVVQAWLDEISEEAGRA